jgi:hypothetical protein
VFVGVVLLEAPGIFRVVVQDCELQHRVPLVLCCGRYDDDMPETATRQVDFVFASDSLKDRLRIRALNAPDEWGPSDHCRVLIELSG